VRLGTEKARAVAEATMEKVRGAMHLSTGGPRGGTEGA